ncbi:class I SAM-dependent DNA methyltransferase [Apilactobacillus xinyiensis]|uniref:class I SAM-dependent DNA methyltransferase n=1 Tax=Apilactobacillus xinyiensis TaxID=2841032 RepID=UPI00200E09A6|nr:class I SAM-dependent methyltransferase [Apilactobacillus xinyiensis]MCL0329495.1 class I SAM-dependent methyltransferase [Apilactobacillus xinyiensis]
MIYTSFAQLYDELFDYNMYNHWLQFVKDNVDTSSNIINIACGNGRLDCLLISQGYNVTGLDLSNDMLSIASKHANDMNLSLPLIKGNMLDLSTIDNYDVATCFDDSLCYLKSESEIETAFTNVFKHLNNGGKYLFDVITPYKTDVYYPGYMYNYHDESRAFMWSSYIGDAPHSVEHDLAFFFYNEEIEAYDSFNEIHYERTYDLKVYLDLLKKVGFKNIKVSADFGKKTPDNKTDRWFFVCDKVMS